MLVFLIHCLVVAVVVLIHYEFLYRLSRWIPRMKIRHRFRIVVGVFGALIAHTLEIGIFALAYYFFHHAEGWGQLIGSYDGSLSHSLYYSFTTFTTLGFGDIEPLGHIRFLTGLESLTGLVLITWTASFLFFEMQRHWMAGADRDSRK